MDSRVGTMFGRYKITALLGKGGMGEVYEACDTDKGRTVALKILADQFSHDERFRTRFRRESHAAAILQEPHVIPIHDWGDIDGRLYIDMRLVRGHTLDQLLAWGPLEPTRAVSIVGQVAAALDAAHAERLIHRDVKPQNIIVTSADFAYLVDFGIAEAKGDTRLTMIGTHIGSRAYMAPERFMDQEVTSAADIYALACVLFEALTGHTPFPAESVEQQIAAHLHAPPPRPSVVNPRVPPSFDEVIARGMAKDPDDRYGSASDLGRAAQRALRADWRVSPSAATLLGPQPTPAPVVATRPYQPPAPPSYPLPAPSQAQGSGNRPGWVVPAVIAAAAALVLGGIGVVIGLLAKPDSSQSADTRPGDGYRVPTPDDQVPSRQVPTTSAMPVTPVALPPPALGADQSDNREVCDQDYSRPGATGFGSHSRRGSAKTSCAFTRNVLNAYWEQYGRPNRESRTVTASGAVPCTSTGSTDCDGDKFRMRCEPDGSGDWVTCTGGDYAVVYLY